MVQGACACVSLCVSDLGEVLLQANIFQTFLFLQPSDPVCTGSLTCTAAPAEAHGGQVEQVHAIEVEVDEELQQVGHVALVRLVHLVHHSAALQELAHPARGRKIQSLRLGSSRVPKTLNIAR